MIDRDFIRSISKNQQVFTYTTRHGYGMMQNNLNCLEEMVQGDLKRGKDCFAMIAENDAANPDVALYSVPNYLNQRMYTDRNGRRMVHQEIVEGALDMRYSKVAVPFNKVGRKAKLADFLVDSDDIVRFNPLIDEVTRAMGLYPVIEKPVAVKQEWLIPGRDGKLDMVLVHNGHVSVKEVDTEDGPVAKHYPLHYWKIGNTQARLRREN